MSQLREDRGGLRMNFSSSYNALKRWSSQTIAAILDQPNRNNPSLVSYTKFKLPVKFPYQRPEFLELDVEATLASADHDIRPVMRPKHILSMDAGYAETINAGKTNKTNEDQSVVKSFVIVVPPEFREEHWGPDKYTIPGVYFGIFDGHAGTGAALMASNLLYDHVKLKLKEISHMLLLDKAELATLYLNHGLIQDVTQEKLVAGALEESFVEMDNRIKQDRYDFFIDGGCTALIAVFILGKLFVANAGDCRAVIYKNFTPFAMSSDHTPETERQRIQTVAYQKPNLLMDEFSRLQFQHRPRKKHIGTKQLYRDWHMSGWALKVIDRSDLKPSLVSGEGKRARLLDTIGVTRGFGDYDIECMYCPGLKIKPFLLPNPEIKVYNLQNEEFSENDVLVMASDGLWERFDNNDVAEILKEKFMQQPKSEPRRYIVAAQALVDEARGTLGERGWRTRDGEVASYDDISVFVIPLLKDWNPTICKERASVKTANDGFQGDDSFKKRYVNRDEITIETGKKDKEMLKSSIENENATMEENKNDVNLQAEKTELEIETSKSIDTASVSESH